MIRSEFKKFKVQPWPYNYWLSRLFNTNVKAVINVTQVCVKKMIASGTAGIVVNISSVVSVLKQQLQEQHSKIATCL